MMPTEFDSSIRAMCGDAVSQAVKTLADKYGFDTEEANRFINLEELKIVRKRGPSPKKPEEKSVAKAEAKAKKASKKDETKPKRAKTGYLMFSDTFRKAVREELTEDLEAWKVLGREDPENVCNEGEEAPTLEEIEAQKVKPQDVVSGIAARWKALGDEGKAEWNAKAKAAKDAVDYTTNYSDK
jgi:hypothetical protein